MIRLDKTAKPCGANSIAALFFLAPLAWVGGASEAKPFWTKGTNGSASPARRMARETVRAAVETREGPAAS